MTSLGQVKLCGQALNRLVKNKEMFGKAIIKANRLASELS